MVVRLNLLCWAIFFVMGCFYVTLSILFSLCFVMDCQRGSLLGSKELGTNVLELHIVMLTNHDKNVLVLFRLAQSMWLYVKLESSSCRIYCVNLLGSINRELDSIDWKLCRLFFCRISNSAQARLTCRVLCFVLSIKWKTLATF